MFKGKQISFPVRLLAPKKTRELIIREHDGTNIYELAKKYNYTERIIWRIVKENADD